MIKAIPLIQSIGQFEHATKISFGKLTLIYGNNGRGKSTLTQIFRSASSDSKILDARRRFNSKRPSEVVIEVDNEVARGAPKKRQTIIYKRPLKDDLHNEDSDDEEFDDDDFNDEGSWTEFLSNFIIYDDFWVNKYVSSGLTIDSASDWRMFELAVGERAKDQAVKEQITIRRSQGRAKLEQFAKTACSGYERTTNKFLKALNASFHIQLKPVVHFLSNHELAPSCDYSIIMHDEEIQIVSRQVTDDRHVIDVPDFSSTLSSGDRNTLALALFFAYLERDKCLNKKIVVIDDPITSLDDNRARATVEELASFVPRVMQMFVLSHDKRFLLRLIEKMDHWRDLDVKALEVVRAGQGSIVRDWNTNDERITEHDRYHRLLLTYYSEGKGNKREVAAAIRPTLEGFARVAYPEDMPAGTLLGRFLVTCRERMKKQSFGGPILNHRDITELQNLLDFGNLFHHDTNPKFESQDVGDEELRGFIRRTIDFTRRPVGSKTGRHTSNRRGR